MDKSDDKINSKQCIIANNCEEEKNQNDNDIFVSENNDDNTSIEKDVVLVNVKNTKQQKMDYILLA